MEKRELSSKYEELAKEVIKEHAELADITCSSVRIAYLTSNLEKKSSKETKVNGQCEKVQNKNKWAINYDFTITIFEPNVFGWSRDMLKILLYHELLHVGIDRKEDGSEEYHVVDHDLEDFKMVIEQYGVNWAEPKGLFD